MVLEQFIEKLRSAGTLRRRQGEINIYQRPAFDSTFDKVELKGKGHPDTLSDSLATHLSLAYSSYVLNKYGIILHHNFDKVGMMGGSASVTFGRGTILSPIRVLLNGRASDVFGNEKIPVQKILVDATKKFFKKQLPMIDPEKDIRILYEVASGSSPGQVASNADGRRSHWFKPRSAEDISYLRNLLSNDTSTGVGYYPMTLLDKIVISLEKKLNESSYKKDKPWLGSDIKITATRHGKKIFMTMCIPQIAAFVNSLEEYKENLSFIREEIIKIIKSFDFSLELELNINTRDDYESVELYLTVTGSSIEMGDEGFVGRGNRGNGIINMTRAFSMEGASGKNPVYHVGLIYTEAAQKIAKMLHERFSLKTEVYLTSQSGRPLLDPKDTTIIIYGNIPVDEKLLTSAIIKELDNIPDITREFMKGLVHPY